MRSAEQILGSTYTEISGNTNRFMAPWTKIEVVRLKILNTASGPSWAGRGSQGKYRFRREHREKQAGRQTDRQIGRHTKRLHLDTRLLICMCRLARLVPHW